MYGGRFLPIEAGYRQASDLAAIRALFTHDPTAWDSVAEQWLEFDHQHQGASGTAAARLDLYRQDTGQLIASVPVDSTTAWQPQRFDLAAVATFQGGGTYYYTLTQTATGAGAGFIRLRNVGVRYAVAVPGSPRVEPFRVDQVVGDGRTLALFALWPMKAYPVAGALAPTWPSSLPTKDRYWVSLAGRDGSSDSDTWENVERPTYWRWGPELDGGAVSLMLEVAGEVVPDPGATTTPRFHLGLFYVTSGDLVRGSIVDVQVSGSALLTSGAFLVRPNEDVVAKVRRVDGTTGEFQYQAVRLRVTVTGGSGAPIVRSGVAAAASPRRVEVTGTTWENAAEAQPAIHGSISPQAFLEATMANSGSGGQAEVRLRNGATTTLLATLTEAGATMVRARSADLQAALEADGVALDSQVAPHDWNAEVDVRGSTAGAKGDATGVQLIHSLRNDPVSDLVSLGAGWVLLRAGVDLDLAAGWKVPRTRDADGAALWRLIGTRNLDSSSRWRLGGTLNLDRAAQFLLLRARDADGSALWRLIGARNLDRATAWRLVAALNRDRSATWRLTGARNLDQAGAWHLGATKQLDRTSTWSLGPLTLATRNLDVSAQWRVVVPSTLCECSGGLEWRVARTQTADILGTWQVTPAGGVGKNSDLAAEVRIRAPHDVGALSRWAVAQPRNLNAAARWRHLVSLNINGASQWLLLVGRNADRSSQWRVFSSDDLDAAAAWRGRVARDVDQGSEWVLVGLPSTDRSASWRVSAARNLDRASSWRVRPSEANGTINRLSTWVNVPEAHVLVHSLISAPVATISSIVPLEVTLSSAVPLVVTIASKVRAAL